MLNIENFDREIIEKKRLAIIFFTAEWCRPSRLQQAVIPILRQEFDDTVLIELIDVDQHEELANRFAAKTLPTTVLYAEGKIVEILAGYQSLEFLQSYLRHLIKHIESKKAEEKST